MKRTSGRSTPLTDPESLASGPVSRSGHRAYRLTRAGGIEANPQAFTARATAFAQTSGGQATLVVARNGTATDNWVIVPDRAAEANAQIALAQTVGARAEPDPGPDLLGSTEHIVRMTHSPSQMMRDPQLGYDPAHLAGLLNSAMRDGSWLAVTTRPATLREHRQWRKWLDHRFGQNNHTHHSLSASSVITTFTAGGPTRQSADAVLAAVKAGMPGFDLTATSTAPAHKGSAAKNLVLGILAVVIGLAAPTLAGMLTGPIAEALTAGGSEPALAGTITGALGVLLRIGLLVAGTCLALPAALKLAGAVPTEQTRLRRALDAGRFPAPERRRGRIRPPREASVKTTVHTDAEGRRTTRDKHIRAFEGDYPLHPTAFMLGASVWAGVASPHGSSGTVTTVERRVPPAMTYPIGPLIGHSDGTPVYLDAAMMTMGTALLGRPSSGKSVTVRTIFAWSCLERVDPSPIPGTPGRNNAIIAFENKGEGLEDYIAWADTVGDTLHPIDVMDPTTPSLDLFDVGGSITDRAAFFAGAMQYAFGDQAIADRSLHTLRQVLTAGLAVTDELIATIDTSSPANARTFTPGRSPVYWADVLLGGRGDDAGVTLYNALTGAATAARDAGTPDPDLDTAVDALGQLYDGKTESNRRTFQEAPRSKTGQLLNVERWFTPRRKRISWTEILTDHRAVVINTGSSAAGMMEDRDSHVISSMIMFSLRRAIQTHCSGWEKQRRSVSIFADELSLLAGTSEKVIGWLRDQGRSFGVRAVFATQRPEQLGPMLRNNLLTFTTLISYGQNDVTTAREVAANMGTGWTEEDLNNLPPYHAIIRSEVGKTRQPSFTAAMLDSESDRSSFIAVQRGGTVPAQQTAAWDPPAEPQAPAWSPPPADPHGPPPSRYGVSAPPNTQPGVDW